MLLCVYIDDTLSKYFFVSSFLIIFFRFFVLIIIKAIIYFEEFKLKISTYFHKISVHHENTFESTTKENTLITASFASNQNYFFLFLSYFRQSGSFFYVVIKMTVSFTFISYYYYYDYCYFCLFFFSRKNDSQSGTSFNRVSLIETNKRNCHLKTRSFCMNNDIIVRGKYVKHNRLLFVCFIFI